MKLFKYTSHKSRAQAMAEFAIAAPVLLLMLYGIIETGRLLFIYSSVNNASRQAVRYGSTTGMGPNGVERYKDCAGIKAAAQKSDFLNAFEDSDIVVTYDKGDASNIHFTCSAGNLVDFSDMRVTVTIDADFTPLMPDILPFLSRTVAGGNPIKAISSRTLLQTINVEPDLEDSIITIDSVFPSPSQIGETVTIIVSVSGPAGTPVGFVTVTGSDGTECSPVKIELSNGTGFCDMVFTTIGDKTIFASYAGDHVYKSDGISVSHTVTTSFTTTSISSHTPNPSEVNQDVNVSVTVAGGVTTPTGTVDITGADTNCSITLVNGTGSCNINFSSAGAKSITATYSGDADHSVSSNTKTHNVILDDQTVTTITSDSPDSSQVNEAVNVYVNVAGVTTPTGTVNVTTSDGPACTITLTNGSGNCSVTFTSQGAKTIFAAYTGDGTHTGSSASEPHAVDLPTTVTTITTHTPDPSLVGQSVAVTVTVTGGATTPTGTVNISTLSGASTTCTITLVNGTGNCNVTFNATGTKTLSAAYSGDGTHAPSNGTKSHTVSNIPPVAGCNSSNIVAGFIQTSGFSMTMSITNNLTSPITIESVTVTWHYVKGHQAGADKTLRLNAASLAGTEFFNEFGGVVGDTKVIAPNTLTQVPASATSTFIFTFHQTYDNKNGTEGVYITFSTPGCDGFYIDQN